jgi:hypothetical protein
MKRIKLTFTLALIMTLTLAACNASPAETVGTKAETDAPETTTAAEEATTTEYAAEAEYETVAEAEYETVAEFANEAGETAGVTTAAETTTATAKKEPAVCGTYRSVKPIEDIDPAEISPEDEPMFYSYINVDQMDDGHFQVEFRDPYGGSDESYAVFDTEALGTSNIINFSFNDSDPIASSSAGGAVTITVEGDTAWVTFGGGEAEEYKKIE